MVVKANTLPLGSAQVEDKTITSIIIDVKYTEQVNRTYFARCKSAIREDTKSREEVGGKGKIAAHVTILHTYSAGEYTTSYTSARR